MRKNRFLEPARLLFVLVLICSTKVFSQHFNFVQSDYSYSLRVHFLSLEVSENDELAVFTTNDSGDPICAGAVILTANRADTNLAAWQDDPQTPEKDGFTNGEIMEFRYWDASEQLEILMTSDYILGNGEWNKGIFAEVNLMLTIPPIIVPVELFGFQAAMSGENVVIQWSTKSEKNAYGFEIQRKNSTTDFRKQGFVRAVGTTMRPQSYQFIDIPAGIGDYTYRLKQIDMDGTFEYSPEIRISVAKPMEFTLHQNYPNPFNPETEISFALPHNSHVQLSIYNTHGQLIETLVDQELRAQTHRFLWNAAHQSSGVYVCRLVAGNNSRTIKLMVVK